MPHRLVATATFSPGGGEMPGGGGTGGVTKTAETQPVVGNLVLTDVTGNAGNPDYLKFDPFADDPSPNLKPTISFKIVDAGDPHRYQWKVYVRDTRANEWNVDGEGNVLVEGETDGPGEVTAHLNDPAATNQTQTGELEDWGTYTFDLYVQEVDEGGGEFEFLDCWWFKSPYKLKIPATMPGVMDAEGTPKKGHELYFEMDENDQLCAMADYYLQDNTDATEFHIDLRDPALALRTHPGSQGLPGTVNAPHLGNTLCALADEDPVGTYIAVFRGADAHGADYRDHCPKRMLAVNKRTSVYRAD